jgi:ATP-binding cassette subfamily F protein 3
VQKAEAEIARLTKELETLDSALADGTLFSRDAGKAAALAKSRADTANALAMAEEEWLAASEALETA